MWNGQQLDNFKVVYDGRDVINNEIEAKLLADSLMGVSESIEEANKILNPQNSAVFIKVKSNFNPGSFEVELIQVLTSPGFQALVNVITVLGFTGLGTNGLIQTLKATKGGKIIGKQKINGDSTEVRFEGCANPIVIQNPVIACYENETIQKSIRKMTKPLEYEGYETIALSSNDHAPEIISRADNAIFAPGGEDGEQILDTQIEEGIFGIAQSNLEGYEKGWKLIKDSDTYFSVTILDKGFLLDVAKGRYSFAHGTAIRVKYRDTTKKAVYITHEYEVLEVISLYPPGSDIPKMVRKNGSVNVAWGDLKC